MLTIAGYDVTELLYSGTRSFIYRGIRRSDGCAVVLKLLADASPTLGAIATLKHEYEILSGLDIPGVIKAVEWRAAIPALVLENFQGLSLKTFLQQEGTLPLEPFLRMAITLTHSLGQVHHHQLIHRDIKPGNFLFNPTTGELKLIDFGLTSQLTETVSSVITGAASSMKNRQLTGTYAYLSPEQTGRINRAVDYRSDFYSLGVTFFQMLTGQLPFQASDPMAWVHCHIAKDPPLVEAINPDVPTVISQIVAKLLAKMAEDRYQQAEGLEADLQACLDQLVGNGQIEPFAIGRRDRTGQFQLPQVLYGRASELDTLLATFDRVSQGAVEIMLVSGYSGVGKSALVNEIHRPIVRQRGYFITGKFDQLRGNVPYSSLIQAFQDLVRQLLGESEAALAQWRNQLQTSLGSNGQVLIDVIPELALIIGPQPTLADVSPAESQVRLNQTFQKMVRVFARPEHPLVLFLDDLQWVDRASLELVTQLVTDTDSGHFLLIGAYRDNEVGPEHALLLTLDQLRKQPVSISTIALQSLSADNVQQLVADTLSVPPETVEPLSSLICSKTFGNAFFTRMLFKTLYREQQLTFDFSQAAWQWDMAELQEISLTDNVVELMTRRITLLNEPTQQLLTQAACIGDRFDLAVLSAVSAQSPDAVAHTIWPALTAGLVIPLGESYRIPMLLEQDVLRSEVTGDISYRFAHDRIQEAAYGLLPESVKAQVHWQLGNLRLQQCSDLGENLFEIVDQLNRGSVLVDRESSRELDHELGHELGHELDHELGHELGRELGHELNHAVDYFQMAELNWRAGRKAKEANAYAAALEYFNVGLSFLPEVAWQHHYQLTFELHRDRAECEYLCGHFEPAERFFEETLTRAHTVIDQVSVHVIRLVLYDSQGKFAENLAVGGEALRSLGLPWPQAPEETAGVLETEMGQYRALLETRPISELVEQPEMSDVTARSCMQLLVNMTGPAYFTDPTLVTLVTLKMAILSMEYGNSQWASQGYTFWGAMLAAAFQDYETAYTFGQVALQLKERYNNYNEAKVLNSYVGFISHWRCSFASGIGLLRRAYRVGAEIGDVFTGYIVTHLGLQLILMGTELDEINAELTRYLAYLRKSKNEVFARQIQVYLYCTGAYQTGVFSTQGTALEDFEEGLCLELFQKNQYFPGIVSLSVLKTTHYFLLGQYDQALALCQESALYIAFAAGMPGEAEFVFYHGLVSAALYETADKAIQPTYCQTLETSVAKLEKWAENCPDNYQHKHFLLVAELARVGANTSRAIDYYSRAIASAQDCGFVQNEAISNELAAQFWLSQGNAEVARNYAKSAYYAYQRWGAIAKSRQLERQYPNLLSSHLPATVSSTTVSSTTVSSTTVSSTTVSDTGPADSSQPSTLPLSTSGKGENVLDLSTVMKASQAIASEIRLEKLLQTLMQIVIENVGAQTGVLILPQGDDWGVKAIGRSDDSLASRITLLASESVPLAQVLPISMMNYVVRTQKPVLITDGLSSDFFLQDQYIVQHRPKSLLCTPILNQGQLIGLIYFENNLTTGVFTPERLEILNLLLTQIAISLTNAQLYEEMEVLNVDLQQEVMRRRSTEETLRENEQRLNQLLEGVPVGVFVMDSQGQPYYVNQAAQQILGKGIVSDIAPADVNEAYQVYQAGSAEIYPMEKAPIFQALQGNRLTVDDMEIRQGDRTIPLEVSGTPVFDSQGEIVYAIAAFQDITQRKQADQQRVEFTETLTAKNKALEQAQSALTEANRTLEQRVKVRTQELTEILKVLKATQAELVVENELLRASDQPSAYNYQVGGSLAIDAPTYVVRQADRQLYKALRRGQYCYIFNARQMGKSSLRVQMMKRMQAEGMACVSIDLSVIGNRNTTQEQWYAGFMYILASSLKLRDQVDIRAWWQDNSLLAPLQRLGEFVSQVVLSHVSEEIVVFIDEVDSVLSLDFDADDFFIWLRTCFNQRADNPHYQRLTFVLFGVATPSQLIQDAYRTPFNIGQAIELNGFEPHEAHPLLQGFSDKVARPQSVLSQVLAWTGGQPFLSQKICQLIRHADESILEGEEKVKIDALVQSRIISNWETKDDPEHLKTIRDRVLSPSAPTRIMLEIYQQLLADAPILADDSVGQTELRLSGLVVQQGNYLSISNRLYAAVFNQSWVERTLQH